MPIDPFIEAIKIALPFGAAVMGWFVASSLQDKRERRKEIRGLMDEAKSCIRESHSLAIQYYSKTNKHFIGELSAKLKFQNMLISQYLIIINQAGLRTGGSYLVVEFSKLTTGDMFETEKYSERFNDSQWQSNLSFISQEMMMNLEKSYFSQFKIKGIPPQLLR